MRIAFNRPTMKIPLYCDSIGYDWNQPPIHRLNGYYAYHWLQTESGMGMVNLDHQHILLKPNQGILCRPRVPHEYHPTGSEPWKVSFLSFDGTIANDMAHFLKLNQFLLVQAVSPELTAFIPQTFNQFKPNDNLSLPDQSIQIYKFIMLLKQNELLNTKQFQSSTITSPILAYISNHFAEPISNQDLSKVTSYSVTYQNRVFKRLFKMTPLEYLNQYRMKKAKELLLTNAALEVHEVGIKVGFHDTSHFIDQFKKFYQTTPSHFRKYI